MYVSSQHGGRINSRRCNFILVMHAFATHNVLATEYIYWCGVIKVHSTQQSENLICTLLPQRVCNLLQYLLRMRILVLKC